MIFVMFWGTPAGSLCQLREYMKRVQVDKDVKCYNVGDVFSVFKAHFLAVICTQLGLKLE